jgi:uncharacterized protein (DUF488 family)
MDASVTKCHDGVHTRIKEDSVEEKTVEVLSIGHSNHGPDAFKALLKQHGIDILVDVRSKPSSRFPHFKRDNLIQLTHSVGVKYLFGGLSLGGMSNYGPKDQLFVTKMDTIVEHAANGKRIVMMCSEGKACECHRAGKLTAWLHRQRVNVKTTHIMPNGETVDGRVYEPTVIKAVRWPDFSTEWPK